MKFGTLYAYWTHEWTGDYKYFAKKVASLGFDILEISAGDLICISDGEIDAPSLHLPPAAFGFVRHRRRSARSTSATLGMTRGGSFYAKQFVQNP